MTEAPQLTRRRAETREKLLDAAVIVFAERGILGASVEQICEQAAFTRGAFYSNFDSRDELVLALLEREASEQIARAHAAIDSMIGISTEQVDDSSDLIGAAISTFAQSQPANRTWILAQRELHLYAVRNPEITPEFLNFEQRCMTELNELILRALKTIGRELTLPSETALAMLTALYEDSMFRSLLRPPTPEAKANTFALMEDFLRSITRPQTR